MFLYIYFLFSLINKLDAISILKSNLIFILFVLQFINFSADTSISVANNELNFKLRITSSNCYVMSGFILRSRARTHLKTGLWQFLLSRFWGNLNHDFLKKKIFLWIPSYWVHAFYKHGMQRFWLPWFFENFKILWK